MALLARQLYLEAVKVGDELPPLVKPPVDRVQIARYAGASLDFNPLSVDEQFAKNSGFPSALAPTMLAMGFLGELVVDWLRGARLRRFWSRFVKIVWPGDVITSRGRVTERRFESDGVYLVEIELWAENQRGELVVRGGVTSQLYYNADDEARQRAGSPPVVVTAEEEAARLAKLTRGGVPAARREVTPRPGTPAAPAPQPVKPVAVSPTPARAQLPVKLVKAVKAPPPARAPKHPPAVVRKAPKKGQTKLAQVGASRAASGKKKSGKRR